MLSIAKRHRFNDIDIESTLDAELLENAHVACAAVPEPVIISDEQTRHPEPRPEDAVYEIFGGIRGQVMGEREQREIVDAGFGKHLELLFARREKLWRRRRVHHLQRVGVEAHNEARKAICPGARHEPIDDIQMPAVNSIECADSNHGCRDSRRQSRFGNRAISHRLQPR